MGVILVQDIRISNHTFLFGLEDAQRLQNSIYDLKKVRNVEMGLSIQFVSITLMSGYIYTVICLKTPVVYKL